MKDKFLEVLDAEIAYMEMTENLSEEEQEQLDELWGKSVEHQRLKAMIREAIFEVDKIDNTDTN